MQEKVSVAAGGIHGEVAMANQPDRLGWLRRAGAAVGMVVAMSLGFAMHDTDPSVSDRAVAEAAAIPEGGNDFDQSHVIDAARAELGTQRPHAGDNDPGQCIVAVGRWVNVAAGKQVWQPNGMYYSSYTRSGAVEVDLNELQAGDVLQRLSTGADFETNSNHVHTAVFESYGVNGAVNTIDSNLLLDGTVREHLNYSLADTSYADGTTWGWHAFRFGKVSSGAPAPGPDGHIPYAAIADNADFYTDEGWAYKKVGGAAFLLGRRNGLDTGKWGAPVGPVPVSETHDHEVGYGDANAHPPRDYTTVYIDGSTQQWTFFRGRAYAVGPGELPDLGTVDGAVRIPSYGNRLAPLESGAPRRLPNGTMYRVAGQSRVGQLVQQPDGSWKSFYVASQTAVDCLRLTQGLPVIIVPQGAQAYVEDSASITGADDPARCSFPPGWALNGPGGVEKWRIEGDGGPSSPYRRRYYPDPLTLNLHTSGNPQYVQLPTTFGLNGIPEGPWMHIPEGAAFVNNGNGDEFVSRGNEWHRVPWPDMNTCLGITPAQIIHVPADAVGALPQGALASCAYSNRLLAYNGMNYYIDVAGSSHVVPNEAVKNCIAGRRGTGPVADVNVNPVVQYPAGGLAYCPYQTDAGLNFVHEGADPTVWLLTTDQNGKLYKRHASNFCLPDPTTTQLKKYHLFRVPVGETAGIPRGDDWFGTPQNCTALPGDGLEVHQSD